jgi:predicted PhzF superfamily epimerase YddE/YHI9
MRTPIYQIDAFTSRRFAGNPAAVMPMNRFLSDAMMLAIAAENNLSETAFLVPEGSDYRLRWFTPKVEVPLCGHATLASAAVVMERLEVGRDRVIFHSASGPLTVKRSHAGYIMDLPTRLSEEIASPRGLAEALGAVPLEVWINSFNYMAVLENAKVVRELVPEMASIARQGQTWSYRDRARRRSIRFRQPLLCSSQGYSRRSGDRCRPLYARTLLGEAAW